MNVSSNKDFFYAMTPLKVLSWPLGTWPLQRYNVASVVRFTIVIIILLTAMTILNTEMYLDRTDPDKNLDGVILITSGVLALSKVICFRVYSANLISNFVSAVKDYKELDSVEKQTIMRRHAYLARMSCVGLIFFSYCGSTFYTTIPMLVEKEEEVPQNASEHQKVIYPIPSDFTLELLNVPKDLDPIISVIEYLLLLIISTGNLGSDSVFFGIVFHFCGQAEILKQAFAKFINENDNAVERFDRLIARHCHLMNLFEKLSNTISTVLLIQLFASCVLIVMTGFQFIFSLIVRNVIMATKTFIVMFVLTIQLFTYSYVGNYSNSQLEDIGYYVYCCNWFDLPTHLSKDLIFIIMRSQSPMYLKAGKFFVVNMETYMTILKTSMSYLSILRVMVNV